jgi:hypothetical protein
MVMTIGGKDMYVWRAADEGEVLVSLSEEAGRLGCTEAASTATLRRRRLEIGDRTTATLFDSYPDSSS